MLDKYKRQINYLRISVTDRCNLRCEYCMPSEGVPLLRHDDILTFEEITEVVRIAADIGIDKVRITGGEPLVRKGIVDLVRMIAAIPEIKDLSMTTNGIFLEQFAAALADAGLQRVNVSLDTTNPEKFRALTRGGDIRKVLSGIRAAEKAGLTPIKLNCVIIQSSDEPDALEVKDYARNHGYEVRFIHRMNLREGKFYVVEGGEGGNCAACNRLRLTANGMIKPCLFNDLEYPVRKMGAYHALLSALKNKPACGSTNYINHFNNIGG